MPEYVWEEKPGQITMPISRTIARVAMTNQVTILTTDARVDPRFAAGESIKIHGISSALCAPLIVDDQALGVVYLESSLSKGGFRPEDEHLLSAMANFAAVGIQREREAKFRQRLERYHSPQVVDQILKSSQSKEAPALQAQRCQISVLFADISGFTRMSEGMEPLVLAGILNRTFEAMTDQIFSRGGTLDKYIGDAIVAFWNAPVDQVDHAVRACRAAVRCGRKLADRRPEFEQRTGAVVKARIGMNTGSVVVGNMGSYERFNYTILGDAANLASRLEGANKAFGTYSLVSETTWEQSGGIFVGRELGRLRVVGRKTPVRVYELAGLPGDPIPDHFCSFAEALELFYQGHFAEALVRFERFPEDPASNSYAAQCRLLLEHPPTQWDGVLSLTEK